MYPGAPPGLVFPGDTGISRGLSPTQFGNVSPRARRRVLAEREDEPARQLRPVLHRVSGAVGRHHVRRPAVRLQLPEPGAAAVRARRSSPPPTARTTASGFRSSSRRSTRRRASRSPTSTGRSSCRSTPTRSSAHDNKTPYSANFMFSVAARAGAEHGRDGELRRHARPQHARACSRPIRAIRRCASASARRARWRRAARRAVRSRENGVFTRDGRHGDQRHAHRARTGLRHGHRSRRRSATRATTALELNLHYTQGPGEHPRRLHAQQVGGRRRRTSASRSIRSTSRTSEAPSAFDMRHNFVVSYSYELPFERLFKAHNALTDGWSLSGTTRLSSGFPVTLYNPTDTSLLGTFGNGVNNNLLDTPNYTPGCDLKINHDPAKGPAFNTDCFSLPALGQLRQRAAPVLLRPGHRELRPGADQARARSIRSATCEMRLEAFNVFNHPQFYGAGAVDGNIVEPDVRQDRRGGRAAVHSARGEVQLLASRDDAYGGAGCGALRDCCCWRPPGARRHRTSSRSRSFRTKSSNAGRRRSSSTIGVDAERYSAARSDARSKQPCAPVVRGFARLERPRSRPGFFLETSPSADDDHAALTGFHFRPKFRFAEWRRFPFHISVSARVRVHQAARRPRFQAGAGRSRRSSSATPARSRCRSILVSKSKSADHRPSDRPFSSRRRSSRRRCPRRRGSASSTTPKPDSIKHFEPLAEQHHLVFPAIDIRSRAGWNLNLGVGRGLTGSSEHWVVKSIIGLPLPR